MNKRRLEELALAATQGPVQLALAESDIPPPNGAGDDLFEQLDVLLDAAEQGRNIDTMLFSFLKEVEAVFRVDTSKRTRVLLPNINEAEPIAKLRNDARNALEAAWITEETEQHLIISKLNRVFALVRAIANKTAVTEHLHESGRENSTAMVVVPGTAPGRNTCAFIRRFVKDRSKLIVVVQQGDLTNGSFERMLRASMADCEKKLRVMEAGGPSLADAINSAERNRHYRPSQALEVYCDEATARAFQQEVSDGSLKFDPTVIRIVPTSIPSDDVEDIRKAVDGGDEAAMHRVLDPHIFSDQDGLTDYRQALLHESEIESMVDEVLREFLTDIAPSKQDAIDTLAGIIQQHSGMLKSRGADISKAKYLGAGNNGAAWQLRNGNVLKVTTDDAEAHVAAHIKGKRFKHIFTIHDVWAFPGQYNGHHVYGLITEGKLEKPDSSERNAFDWMVDRLEEYAEQANVNLEDDLRLVLQTMMSSDLSPANKRQILLYVKQFDLPSMMGEMKKLGVLADLHSGNFMRRPDGTFVIIDIGTGGSDQESAKPPFLEGENIFDIDVPTLDGGELNEFGFSTPGTGANGTMQTRGSNSSSWSSGALALHDPRNHVPEEDEEDSREMDWGPGRVSGASF